MASPYLGEIRMFAGNYAPPGWAVCDGSLIAISANQPLFQLIRATYGGDGVNTFALPDLRGRLPLCQGLSHTVGQTGGTDSVTLTVAQMPAHLHALQGDPNNGSQANPSNNVLASSTLVSPYIGQPPDTQMAATAIATNGGGQPHENRQPFLSMNFIIATTGDVPTSG